MEKEKPPFFVGEAGFDFKKDPEEKRDDGEKQEEQKEKEEKK